MRASRVLAFVLGAAAVCAALVSLPANAAKDDRTQAEALLAPLEGDAGPSPVTRDAVKRSRDLLERARRMRVAGDDAHARLAEASALEWAKVASELVRTNEAEQKASSARSAVLDASAALERERAMLEQQLAQNGRLQAELRNLEDAAPVTLKTDASAIKDAGAKR